MSATPTFPPSGRDFLISISASSPAPVRAPSPPISPSLKPASAKSSAASSSGSRARYQPIPTSIRPLVSASLSISLLIASQTSTAMP